MRHAAAAPVGHGGSGDAGTEPGGGDDVVAAGVTDAREGVVLETDRDVGAPAAAPSDERGVEAERVALRADPLLVERVAEQVVGVAFLEVELGVRVDQVRDLDQPVGAPVDLGGHRFLDRIQLRGRVLHAGSVGLELLRR